MEIVRRSVFLFSPKIFGPNWIRFFIDCRGFNKPESEPEEEESRQEDKGARSEQAFIRGCQLSSGEERSRSPFKIWPDLGSELKRRGLKAYSGRQSWPISGQTDAPGIKVRLIGAIHIQTRSTSLTVHLARPAKLITVRGGEFCCSNSIRLSFLFLFLFFFLIFSFWSAGRCPARKVRQVSFSRPFFLARGKQRRNLSEIPSGRFESSRLGRRHVVEFSASIIQSISGGSLRLSRAWYGRWGRESDFFDFQS